MPNVAHPGSNPGTHIFIYRRDATGRHEALRMLFLWVRIPPSVPMSEWRNW